MTDDRYGPPHGRYAPPPRRAAGPAGGPRRGAGQPGPARPQQRPQQRSQQRPPVRSPQRRAARPARTMRLGAFHPRLRFGFAAVCTLLLITAGRLVQLQGLDHSHYASAAHAQRVDTIAVHALRGSIVDRNGTTLAYTSAAQDITVDPAQITAAERASYAAKLAPLVGQTPDQVSAVLAKPGQYAVLARALSPLAAQKISDLSLAGIYSEATTQRQYPGHTTAANLIGTVHSDGTGAAGIEDAFNSVLAGKDGSITYAVDNVGNINPSSRTVGVTAQNGGTVRLTIDESLQYLAQQYLDQAVTLSKARGATMALLDVHTGQVLALASAGTFDAANPDTINPNVAIDPPVMDAFEPGSVQKAITFGAALQEHLITPQTVLPVADQITIAGTTVSDAWWHPTENFTATGVLAESSNVGTLEIAQRIGPQRWMQYEQAFGVGEKTGVELPAESSGYLPPMSTWSASTFANLPFGQGESMTILQLASIYQTIANNGVRIPPRIVQSVTKPDGTVDKTVQPAGIRVLNPQTASTLRTMLESVIMPGGTGMKAAVPGYRIAGKTGTAQQPDPALGGRYSDWKYWDTFAGIAPADAPQFVAAIMVDNPSGGEGGEVAAPLFNRIASFELAHAQIAPTGSMPKHVPLQVCDAVTREASPSTVC